MSAHWHSTRLFRTLPAYQISYCTARYRPSHCRTLCTTSNHPARPSGATPLCARSTLDPRWPPYQSHSFHSSLEARRSKHFGKLAGASARASRYLGSRQHRGMRRRLGAWAESVGLVEHPRDGGDSKDGGPVGQEESFVMPGWAVTRDARDSSGGHDIAFSISGFCSRSRPPARISRTERFMSSVVQRFAALPNLPGAPSDDQPMGPMRSAVGVAFMEEALEEEQTPQHRPYAPYQSRRRRATPDHAHTTIEPGTTRPFPPTPSRQSSVSSQQTSFIGEEEVSTAHRNLQERLSPFWSTVLPNRRVLFDVYSQPEPEGEDREDGGEMIGDQEPIYKFEVLTDANGHFAHTGLIPWDAVRRAATAHDLRQQRLRIRARLDYEALPPLETRSSYKARAQRASQTYGQGAPRPTDRSMPAIDTLSLNSPEEPQVVQWTDIRVGRADGIHIISDMDDTVKHSDILAGPREVCRNVFCRPLPQLCVPGMDEMYRRLDRRGAAGFHYVSNSPSQSFPSIRTFLDVNNFPSRHSIKLKYYGGRSIFSSSYESPAERKRGSSRHSFDASPAARFILLGDSAEQDLESYVEFAKAYPDRVAAIAIRDVTSDKAAASVENLQALRLANSPSTESLNSRTQVPLSRPSPSRTASEMSTRSDEAKMSSNQQKLSQKALTWQERKASARRETPPQTSSSFFKEPGEVEGVLGKIVDGR